ncbi:3'(2'),5'-bisphosphate nucleotidase CysQ [Psychromarinibacter halotolerans]|uniref:3'(2'),5'-bisphosphate nucleotidase CysQ n=1 Tax=Psychromarinibacter halotolerans TaxID=1775175 RepID=A0ABV7GIU5_9RHOB|nr:3'(2'),5'-bisphosphate nucleotidase CysQ [Psychromarinibacter halotolerans]MDF0596064.1 3'(2'),5'-bisphosphate nucleotidase CysQ [Psychromarinibacter halotolerans]
MPESDADLLSAAASEAAKIAVRYWRTDQKVRDKGDGAGPVSEGDIAVDTYLRKTLTQARPDYGWLSEETPDNPERLSAKRVFIVDPIDGTRAYVDGQTTWAHSLAVVERGKTVAAVVHLPKLEKTYSAQLGGGALLNGEPIATSARTTADRAEVLASRPVMDAAHWPGGVPDVERHFRPSLAYRLCLVAEGRFDAMITLRPTWDWDIAAGALIAAEAGALATDAKGAALRFNSKGAQSAGCVVAPGALHGDFLRRLGQG